MSIEPTTPAKNSAPTPEEKPAATPTTTPAAAKKPAATKAAASKKPATTRRSTKSTSSAKSTGTAKGTTTAKAPAKASAAKSTRSTGTAKTTKTAAKPAKTTAKTAPSPTTHGRPNPEGYPPAFPQAPMAPVPAPRANIARIPIMDVTPCVQNGSLAAKGTVNEAFPVQATVWREGHDLFGCEAVLVDPQGREVQSAPMVLVRPGLGRYEGWLTPTEPGDWAFFVRSWSDPLATWRHTAEAKLPVGQDIDLVFLEAEQLLKRVAKLLPRGSQDRPAINDAIDVVRKKSIPASVRFAAVTSSVVEDIIQRYPVRDFVSESARFPLAVDRELALHGAWYEMFPRSVGAWRDDEGTWHSGTLRTAAEDLPRIASMGFDVVYLTPISPIGLTDRKGKNNSLIAQPGEPGSPYAIGSEAGGHDAIHPDLGTFEDFDAFVATARDLGMEVALDIALQCSPDHPWLREHPEWFLHRPDGTIAFAENPPKKYQDIYPLNFDDDPEGIYQAVKGVLETWVSHGVTLFRVDNPHTKPVSFWQRLLAEFRQTHPEVIFLAEAFTAPPMMRGLGAVGFHQSYCYFAWRNEKKEIEDYLWEVGRESDAMLRPTFWPTTHDILTPYLQHSGPNGWKIRAILAAMGSPSYGIYSGYEFVESEPRGSFEEMNNNEKYEYRPRDYSRDPYGIQGLLTRLNEIRKEHVALQRLRGITINPTSNPNIVCFTKVARPEETPSGTADRVIVVINLDPHTTQEAEISLDMSAFGAFDASGLPLGGAPEQIEVVDELGGGHFQWNNRPFVRLNPFTSPAHILSVKA
ncbi:alpha-1,4-glucan--maltose-1-phosphate maltosyltransferase [Actinotignum sp. GS-2025a]|uniref:alpha-1,4-glucan--maltose-1-phosphate maltosyltransferase n=1 Tax=Actinotignum sp. GS-2025a TaxID=3427274 RepID=UPI003F45DDEB